MLEIVDKISNLISEVESIKAIVKNVRQPIEVGGNKIILEPEGAEIQIPKWASEKMLKMGLIELKTTEELGIKDIRKILWKESRETSLAKIDPQFYAKVRQKIQKMREELKKEPTPEKIQEQRNYESTFIDIVNCRIQKILQLAITEAIPQTIMENMTMEEKMLLREIRYVLSTWKNKLISIGENL
ncbi:MAG: hypothetical protein QXZ54_02075 [Candidatus Methanomethylicia archaeon]